MHTLSIIIPAFNAQKFLDECLQSILVETSSTEIIVIDDGSTDNTLQILKNYVNQGVRVLTQDQKGVSAARNLGLSQATGKYIMFVDADDKLKKGWANTLFRQINNGNDIIFFSQYLNTNWDKKNLTYAVLNMQPHPFSGPYSKVIKADLIQKNGLKFNTKIVYAEDLIFNLELMLYAKKILVVDDSLYCYRWHLGSTTHTLTTELLDSYYHFLTTVKKILQRITFFSIEEKKFIMNSLATEAICHIGKRSLYNPQMRNEALLLTDKIFKDYSLSINFNNGWRKLITLTLVRYKLLTFLSYLMKIKHKIESVISQDFGSDKWIEV